MEDKEQKIKLTFETNADDTGQKVEGLNKKLDGNSKETEKVAESQKKASKSTQSLGTTLEGLGVPIGGAISGFKGMLKQMWLLVANPIGATIAAVVGVFALLYQTLKNFDPVLDALEQGFNAIKAVFDTLLDGVLALVTGTKSLGEVFGNLGSDIKGAAKEAIEFTKAQQDLDDAITRSTVNQAKYNKEINELILQSKDRTKTEAERIALIDKALAKETEAFKERKAIADGELRDAQNKIISEANLSKAEQKALRERGVSYAQELQAKKGFDEALIKTLAEKLAKQENIENESISLREKALNRKYTLEDAAIEKQKALEDKAEKGRAVRDAAKVKADADAKIAKLKADEEYFAKVIQAQKDRQDEIDGFKANIADLEQQDKEQKEKDRVKEVDDKVAAGQKLAEGNAAQIKADQALVDQKAKNKDDILETGNALITGAKMLAGKNKALQKAAIIAEGAVSLGKVGVNIATGVSKDASSGAVASIPQIIKTLATGAFATTSIIANTASALKALGSGGGGLSAARPGGASGGATSATPQVSFQASSENQIANTVSANNKDMPPIQAYVVGKDVTTQQALDNNKINSNSI